MDWIEGRVSFALNDLLLVAEQHESHVQDDPSPEIPGSPSTVSTRYFPLLDHSSRGINM